MSLTEKARLEYLQSMGVKQWVARRDLDGAAPSPRLIPVGKPTPKEQAAQGKPSLNELKTAIADTSTAMRSELTSISDEFKASKKHAEVEQSPTDLVRLNLSIFSVGGVMILCEQPLVEGVHGLQYPHRVLIADAIRIMLGSYDERQLREDDFNWPWAAPAGSEGGCKEDAKLAISALVSARKPRVLLVFGSALSVYLDYEGAKQIHSDGFEELIANVQARQALAQTLFEATLESDA